jgi:hypothetical protein
MNQYTARATLVIEGDTFEQAIENYVAENDVRTAFEDVTYEDTKNSDAYIVVVDNGDVDMEYWGFHSPDHAQSFAALRGGDVEDITIMGESDALAAIDNEESM